MEVRPPKLLPLFPLPNVVLFPGVFLPLHVFEARYRALMGDILGDDRRLGMVLLQPGWEDEYEGRPAVFPVGCSATVVHEEPLDDGRYNIVVRGLERFRILEEVHDRPYRRAATELLPDAPLHADERTQLAAHRLRLNALVSELMDRTSGSGDASPLAASAMPDADLVHALAQGLDLDPLEKQALLQEEDLCARAQSLVELIEMRRWRIPGSGRMEIH